jgi:hypothetical protein
VVIKVAELANECALSDSRSADDRNAHAAGEIAGGCLRAQVRALFRA